MQVWCLEVKLWGKDYIAIMIGVRPHDRILVRPEVTCLHVYVPHLCQQVGHHYIRPSDFGPTEP